jgi:hypothetical protein
MQTDQTTIQAQLDSEMAEVMKRSIPYLQDDRYKDLLDKIIEKFSNTFSIYLRNSKHHKSLADSKYSDAEIAILESYVRAAREQLVPQGANKESIRKRINQLLEKVGRGTASVDRGILSGVFDQVFSMYVAFSKVGYKKHAEEIYQFSENNILSNFRAELTRARIDAAKNGLKEKMTRALDAASLDFEDYQVRRVHDQMFYIFRDYAQAPDEEKDRVYEIGEERLLFSLFQPAKGMYKSSD